MFHFSLIYRTETLYDFLDIQVMTKRLM